MRYRFLWAVALLAGAAGAQPRVQAPGGFVPQQAMTIGAVGNTAVPVTAANPLPVAAAQRPAVTSASSGAAIAAANVYQQVMAASTVRKGCAIYNTSAAAMLVYLGAPGAATAAASIPLPAGAQFSCTTPALVIGDQISITSATAGATFVVVAQ